MVNFYRIVGFADAVFCFYGHFRKCGQVITKVILKGNVESGLTRVTLTSGTAS